MKKIITLIAILCSFGFCDTVIKIYNKTTGKIVKTFTNNDCANNSLWLLDGDVKLTPDKIHGIVVDEKNFKQINIGCDDSKSVNKEAIVLGIYDASLFAYSVEYVEYTTKNKNNSFELY